MRIYSTGFIFDELHLPYSPPFVRGCDLYNKCSVVDPGCLWSRIRIFSIPDPNFLHPGSRICIKEFKYFNPQKMVSEHCQCSSQIRILIFSTITDPGSRGQKRHRIPDPQHWTNVFRTRAWATAGADSCGRVPPTPSTDGTSSGSSALDPSTRGNYHKINNMYKSKQMISRVADPHWFNADPDPAFFLIAAPDPDPGSDDLKLKKNTAGNLSLFSWSKIILRHP